MKEDQGNISDEMLAAFLDGNVSEAEAASVLNEIGNDSDLAEVLSISAQVDEDLEREKNRILPIFALAAANPENLCSLECEAFILHHHDIPINHFSLLEEAKANNWLREGGTPLHHVGKLLELKGLVVSRMYDATVADLEKALDNGFEVIAIVDENILKGNVTSNSPKYHAIYMTWAEVKADDIEYLNLDTLLDERVSIEEFRKAWVCSGNYMVTVRQTADGYNPTPINVEDVELDDDLIDLTEAIAENAHDVWAEARIKEGWTYGKVRDDEAKTHPDLVPYSALPDSEKEYDRIMAMKTLRLVKRLGFDITKRK